MAARPSWQHRDRQVVLAHQTKAVHTPRRGATVHSDDADTVVETAFAYETIEIFGHEFCRLGDTENTQVNLGDAALD